MSTAVSQDKRSAVEAIADAVLYEGYILYPYRPSSVKNQQRWNFGVLCAPSYAYAQGETENSLMQTECLCEVEPNSTLNVTVRFLQLMMREEAGLVSQYSGNSFECRHVIDSHGSIDASGRLGQSWQEAVERNVSLKNVEVGKVRSSTKFSFPDSRTFETLSDRRSIVRTQHKLEGEVEVRVTPLNLSSVSPDETGSNRHFVKLSVVVKNTTQLPCGNVSRDESLMRSCVSAHTVLEIENGAFISSLDPPIELQGAVSQCRNVGAFPVLVGEEGARDCVLSSPIILYDYPQIAPQSAGNLFDGTEIDEILTLRIMSLTDEEKNEMRNSDEMARQLLERTERVTQEDLMKMHGVMRRES